MKNRGDPIADSDGVARTPQECVTNERIKAPLSRPAGPQGGTVQQVLNLGITPSVAHHSRNLHIGSASTLSETTQSIL